MRLNILDNGFRDHAELLERTLRERIPVTVGEGMEIRLSVDEAIGGPESYLIEKTAAGWSIVGSDRQGLYFGIGKFLHTARWTSTDFAPCPPSGVISPACTFRAIYFAVHLHNRYANAPIEELEKYVEELMLWGYNTVVLIIPVIDLFSFEDALCRSAVEKSRSIFQLAKRRGMQVGIIISPNQGLRGAPHEWDADPSFDPVGNVRGNGGRNLCPAKPGVKDYLRGVWLGMLEQYVDMGLDYLITWPYDEGGCGCEKCRPWGARGYLDLVSALYHEAVRLYPEIRLIVSTWTYDRPDDQGEFAGLYKRLHGDMQWVSYIMADSHTDFPRYPLEHAPIKPVVNFPEISMWRLYPWGGYGANPLPERYEGIWRSAKSILGGGMPYSEGMYEDISKIQFAGYYWEPDRPWQEILSEYLGYEVSCEVVDDALRMIELIEKNHVLVGKEQEPDIAGAVECGRLARSIDARLDARGKGAWRWRVLYIRGILDEKRYVYYAQNGMKGAEDLADLRRFAADFLSDDAEAQALLWELRDLYHSEPCNGRNQYTLPFAGEPTRLGNGDTLDDVKRKRKGN